MTTGQALQGVTGTGGGSVGNVIANDSWLGIGKYVNPIELVEIVPQSYLQAMNQIITVADPVDEQEHALAREFSELAEKWRRETRHLSSSHEIALHPAYQRIIGMGEAAIPLVLKELSRRNDHWFWALAYMSGRNPVPPEERGRVQLMRQRWLAWGKERGHQF